jgi:hypothetical protein
MTFQDEHTEGARAMEREARALADGELESRRVAAERALTELRRQLQDAVAWLDALDAEKDRRSVQRRAERVGCHYRVCSPEGVEPPEGHRAGG